MQDLQDSYVSSQLITYLGNKRALLRLIKDGVDFVCNRLGKDKLSILDGFAGSGVVSKFLKQYASILYSNDLEYYAYIIGKCYLANKSELPFDLADVVNHLNAVKLNPMPKGIIEQYYSPEDDCNILPEERAFYTNRNARIIDNVRRSIDLVASEEFRHFYIAPLLSEASVKVNTSGVFKGFYKDAKTGIGKWGGTAGNCLSRITSEIELPVPIHSPFECDWLMFNKDINELVITLPEVDLAYFDPPYNQHPYGSNYFMLNIIAEYKIPSDISRVSGIPKDWNRSHYNSRAAAKHMRLLIEDTNAKFILISYNDEGTIPLQELENILNEYGSFTKLTQDYNTFRGSRNLSDRSIKVQELLYILEKRL